DPELRRSRLVEAWSKRPEHFKEHVIRPRPSRFLKYSGILMMVLGLVCFVGSFPSINHYEPQSAPWWHYPFILVIIFGPYVVLAFGGYWLWEKGRDRK